MGLSVIPYAGAKGRVAFNMVKQQLEQTGCKRYVEAFGGGFSLGLSLLDAGIVSDVVYNDLDTEIYTFWLMVRDKPMELLDCIFTYYAPFLRMSTVTEVKEGLGVLERTLKSKGQVELATYKYLFNKLGNGRSRFASTLTGKNRGDDTTTPIQFINCEKAVLHANELIKGIEFRNTCYSDLKDLDSSSTYWFLDPPYYNADNVSVYPVLREKWFCHTEFFEFVRGLTGYFGLTLDDCPQAWKQYKDYKRESLCYLSGFDTLAFDLFISRKEVV